MCLPDGEEEDASGITLYKEENPSFVILAEKEGETGDEVASVEIICIVSGRRLAVKELGGR